MARHPSIDPADADSAYQTLLAQSCFASAGQLATGGATTYALAPSGFLQSGSNHSSTHAPPSYEILAANFQSNTGRAAKLRLSVVLLTNPTAPAQNLTFGLYKLSAIGGAAGSINFTPDTVVSGSTVLFTTPAANSILRLNSGDFSLPADGAYVLSVAASAAVAANGFWWVTASLQAHWV